jgi:group I intron endonuclease
MFYVYKIRCIKNNKLYIGKAADVAQRWLKHLYDARTNRGFVLHKAINKYGKDNFEISVIEECETDDMALEREIFWIAEYKTNLYKYGNEFGYNMTDGGDGSSGHIASLDARKKMSEASKGKPKSDAHKIALSIGGKGKILSEEHKSKIRSAGTGKKRNSNSKLKYSLSKLGSKNPQAVLDDQKVKDILILLKENKLSNAEIAKIYNVAPRTIRDIKNNISWKHIARDKFI